MPEIIILNYRLTKDIWRLFFEAHYSCDRSLKARYLWGGACIILGSVGFGGIYRSREVAALLLATGFFGVLSKSILIIKSVRSTRHHPFFDKELAVAVSPEKISVRSDNSGYSEPWSNFVGYRTLAPGILLYHDRNAFFFIPSSAMTAGNLKGMARILDAAEVPRL